MKDGMSELKFIFRFLMQILFIFFIPNAIMKY